MAVGEWLVNSGRTYPDAPTPWGRIASAAARTVPEILRLGLLFSMAWTILLAGGTVLLWAQAEDGSDLSREYAIKAAYLYQFGRYVQWPPTAFPNDRAPVVIGVLGTDPFAGILDDIARTKQIEGRPIVIRRFPSVEKLGPCHILFVSASLSAAEKAAAIKKTQGTPVLVVGDDPEFANHGGVIGFFLEQNRVRFAINTEVAKLGQLRISSKLLSLAKPAGAAETR
jgi:hypothetical protein